MSLCAPDAIHGRHACCSVAFSEACLHTCGAARSAESESCDVWAELCAQSFAMLHTLASSHSNKRKVYMAVVGRLMVAILCSSSHAGRPPQSCQK
jgi:hypothetical protein